MVVMTAQVVDGRIVVPEGAHIPEGASVTVLAPDNQETFELGPAEEQAILEAIAQADAGKFVDGDDLLARL
jgi:hypothetical protein